MVPPLYKKFSSSWSFPGVKHSRPKNCQGHQIQHCIDDAMQPSYQSCVPCSATKGSRTITRSYRGSSKPQHKVYGFGPPILHGSVVTTVAGIDMAALTRAGCLPI